MSAANQPSPPTLIRWLIGLVVHGGATSVVIGISLLASGYGPADLLSMQVNITLATGFYLYGCAQIGTSTALLIGCCAEGDHSAD